jgi:hypothetical protein
MVLRQLVGAGLILAWTIGPCSAASEALPLRGAVAKACAGERETQDSQVSLRYGLHAPRRAVNDSKLKMAVVVAEADCERMTGDTPFWVIHRIIDWNPRIGQQPVSYVYKMTPRGEFVQVWRVEYLGEAIDDFRVEIVEKTADVKADFDRVVSALAKLYGAYGDR